MILKTALSADMHPEADLPNAWIAFETMTHIHFNCSCGQFFKLRNTNSFASYESIMCLDCKRKARLKQHIGERYVFKRIKWDAKKAGRSFDLDFEWFVKQVHLPCHYCNRTDINSVTVSSKKPGEVLLANFRYNGLDRVDNSLGYEKDNCVPCCVVCNRAKNSMPYNEFIEYIRGLVNHQNSVGDENVNNEYAVQDSRVPYQGRHRKAGNDSRPKEPQEDSISVSTSQFWTNLYYGADGEVWYSYSGGPYRKLERAI